MAPSAPHTSVTSFDSHSRPTRWASEPPSWHRGRSPADTQRPGAWVQPPSWQGQGAGQRQPARTWHTPSGAPDPGTPLEAAGGGQHGTEETPAQVHPPRTVTVHRPILPRGVFLSLGNPSHHSDPMLPPEAPITDTRHLYPEKPTKTRPTKPPSPVSFLPFLSYTSRSKRSRPRLPPATAATLGGLGGVASWAHRAAVVPSSYQDTMATLTQPSACPYGERPAPGCLLPGQAGATLHSSPGTPGAWVSGDARCCSLR